MKEYNLTWVKCGTNSTYYYNVDPVRFGGNDIIAIDVSDEKEPAKIVEMVITGFQVSEMNAGSDAGVLMAVKNEGNSEGMVKISLNVPWNWNYSPSYVGMILKPGEEQTIKFIVSVPEQSSGSATITGYATFESTDSVKTVSKDAVRTVNMSWSQQMANYFKSIFG